jgi:FtsP/CotA-like multicopper oxidase with cupredoxin domain
MRTIKYLFIAALFGGLAVNGGGLPASAGILVQCPGDTDGSADWATAGEIQPPNTKCIHLGAGDGYITMADGKTQYVFGFSDLTGLPTRSADPNNDADIMAEGTLAANFPGPPIILDEGDELYLTLTNIGMMIRPDLFDPHTVHFHGYPESSNIFDGLPNSAISINMGASLTYYYKLNDPGTYMYHCHVEATEHMQMGMLGSLYVRPAQDGTSFVYNTKTYTKFAYNDGDGSTGYNVDYPLQISSFDSAFHDSSEAVQPLPFALMEDDYPMLNGRGYPDTVNPLPLPAQPGENGGKVTQIESSLIAADAGQRVLLRISNLNVTRNYTLGILGLPMQVVGKDAKLLRGPTGLNLYYNTNSITIGGGESVDAIVEVPADASSGTRYFIYTTNLNYLSNGTEQFGGMMTEIVVN